MRHEKETFDQLGARVVLVGLGSVEETTAFKQRFDVPFPMVADPEKRLFGAFRLKQASAGSLLSAKMLVKGVAAMAKGHKIGIPRGDVRQLPGVFIIDADSHLRFSHYAASPEDHPQPNVLFDALRHTEKQVEA